MNKDYTTAEIYTLPSKGMVYKKMFDPDIKLRSMTASDEMKRLAQSPDAPNKNLCDVIDDCIVSEPKPPISCYDMCLGDYEFLLHKLRVVTYGSEYKILTTCPVCGGRTETVMDLDSLEKKEFDEEKVEKLKLVELPVSGKTIKLKFQTQRIRDQIEKRRREMLKNQTGNTTDPGFILTLMSVIDEVDGSAMNEAKLEFFIRNLPMKDANILIKKAVELNESVGLNTDFTCTCKHCGTESQQKFRLTSEFFGPTID